MSTLFKRRVDPLEFLASGRLWRAGRGLGATACLVLSLLAAMQLVNPGAVQRIASQTAGRGLLAALAVLLMVVAVLGLADYLLQRPRNALEPGLGDALLHFAFACTGLEVSVLRKAAPHSLELLLCGGLGFCLVAAGLLRLVRGVRDANAYEAEFRARKLLALSRRDHLARGAAFVVLGAFLAAVATNIGFDVTRSAWATGILILTVLALAGYGLHTIWALQEEERMWAL